MPNPSALKGWRTLLFNFLVVVVPVVATWAAGVNWTDYVSPTAAFLIVSAANMVLRYFTTTPVGHKE